MLPSDPVDTDDITPASRSGRLLAAYADCRREPDLLGPCRTSDEGQPENVTVRIADRRLETRAEPEHRAAHGPHRAAPVAVPVAGDGAVARPAEPRTVPGRPADRRLRSIQRPSRSTPMPVRPVPFQLPTTGVSADRP